MPDFRQSREEEYLPTPLLNYTNDPSYTPLDQIGGQGMGGMGNDSGLHPAHAALLDRITGGLERSEQLGQESRGLMEALQANHEVQRAQGGGMGLSDVWQGFKDAGSAGMEMLGHGLNAITPNQSTIDNIAMRLQNAHAIGNGQTPLYMLQQQHAANMQQNQEMMAFRRQQMATQLQQVQERKRQGDMQLLEKAMVNPRASALLEQLGQDPNYSMAPQAAMLHKAMKDADYGAFNAYRKFIPEDIQTRFMNGELPQHELNAWLDMAREAAKADATANAKSTVLSRAMNKEAGSRTPFEAQLVEEHQNEQELNRLKRDKIVSETSENNAQAAKYTKEAESGKPDRSNMNHVAMALTGMNFYDLPPGSPIQRMVLDHYSKLYAQGRQDVQQAAPMSVKERSDIVDRAAFLKSGVMNRPAAGTSVGETNKGDFIQMSDAQQKQAGDVDKAGNNLRQLFDLVMPMIKAKTPLEVATQYTRLHTGAFAGQNPDAATYKAGSEAFSSQLARVFGGEVGVMTNQDITRWQNTLPTFGDTKQVAERKKKLFFEIYDNATNAFRNQVAGEKSSTDKLEGLLRQADNFKTDSTEKQTSQRSDIAQPASKAEYDKLPSGSLYMKDGKVKRKQ